MVIKISEVKYSICHITIILIISGMILYSCSQKKTETEAQGTNTPKTSDIKIEDQLEGIKFYGITRQKALGIKVTATQFLMVTSQNGEKVIGLMGTDSDIDAPLLDAFLFEGTFNGKELEITPTHYLRTDTSFLYSPLATSIIAGPGDDVVIKKDIVLSLSGSNLTGNTKLLGIASATWELSPLSVPDFILSNYERGNQVVVGYDEQKGIIYTVEVEDGEPVQGTLKRHYLKR
jgi:hypothetical protein